MARPDFRAAAARRLSEERELSPAIVSLLTPDSPTAQRRRPHRPARSHRAQPRAAAPDLRPGDARRARRVDPRARRAPAHPRPPDRTEALPAHRRRASLAGLAAGRARRRSRRSSRRSTTTRRSRSRSSRTCSARTSRRSTRRRCTTAWSPSTATASASWPRSSARTRATSRTGCASPTPRTRSAQLVSLRKDTLSHAYELMKVEDPKKRRRLAEQVARGELTLVKLRDKIEGRRDVRAASPTSRSTSSRWTSSTRLEPIDDDAGVGDPGRVATADLGDDSLINAKASLADALDELVGVLRIAGRGPLDRRRRPGEPGQVPDHRQAPAGERDRHRPHRRRRLSGPTPRPAGPTPRRRGDAHRRSPRRAVQLVVPLAAATQPWR